MKTIQKRLANSANRMVVCGMILGYADMSAPEDHFAPKQMSVDEFARFVDDLTKYFATNFEKQERRHEPIYRNCRMG